MHENSTESDTDASDTDDELLEKVEQLDGKSGRSDTIV